jgi:hypothetical protein
VTQDGRQRDHITARRFREPGGERVPQIINHEGQSGSLENALMRVLHVRQPCAAVPVGIENSKISVGMEAAPDIGTEMPVEAITMGSRNVQQQAL